MPKGYALLTEAIHDREGMEAYKLASLAPLLEHDGKLLVVDEHVEALEGSWHGNRTVLVEFESVERAHEWYASASYQAVLPLRKAAADCQVVILSGRDQPPPS